MPKLKRDQCKVEKKKAAIEKDKKSSFITKLVNLTKSIIILYFRGQLS